MTKHPKFLSQPSSWTRKSKHDNWARRAWKTLSTQQEKAANGVMAVFANRKAVLLIALLAVGIGVLVIDQGLKRPGIKGFFGGTSPIDPSITLWDAQNLPASAGEWRLSNTVYQTCLTGINCLRLQANATFPAIALEKQSISIDTVGGHQLSVPLDYCHETTPGTTDTRWGIYFTSNATLPLTAGYNPRNDLSVSFVLEVQQLNPNTATKAYLWNQREPTQTILSGDTSGGQQGTGTLYITLSVTQDAGVCASQLFTAIHTVMNYTGSGTTSQPGRSFLTEDVPNTPISYQGTHPWFNFESQNFYIGYFHLACSSCSDVGILGSTGHSKIERTDPIVSTPTPPQPTLDSGGFFGPIIRALINLGVFIMSAIAKFFGIVVDAFVTAFDTIGNFFGFGPIGTQIRNFFVGIGGFITNVIANGFGQLAIFITFLGNLWTAFSSLISGFFSSVATFLGQVANLFGIIGTIWSFLFYLFPAGVNILQILLVFDFAFWVYLNMKGTGFNGTMQWYRMNYTIFIGFIGKGVYWFIEESIKHIVSLKNIIAGWI